MLTLTKTYLVWMLFPSGFQQLLNFENTSVLKKVAEK